LTSDGSDVGLMQVVEIKDVSYCGFLAMLQFIYTNDFDESVSPSHMVELMRSLYCLVLLIRSSTDVITSRDHPEMHCDSISRSCL